MRLCVATIATVVAGAGVAVVHVTDAALPTFPVKQCSSTGCERLPTKIIADAKWKTNETSYESVLGISQPKTNALRMNYMTKDNIGARVYVTEEDEQSYKMFKLLNKEFAFDIDVANIPCALTAAMYFVGMDPAGGATGTGYCDAQCDQGNCCMEFDLWEGNSISHTFAAHPCSAEGLSHDPSACDTAGCDFNPFRLGVKDFYGPGEGFAIDSTKPITVVTQFKTTDGTDAGDLSEVRRVYMQNGKVIQNTKSAIAAMTPFDSLTEDSCLQIFKTFAQMDVGGLKQMSKALKGGVALALSVWDDPTTHLAWLDATPKGDDPSQPGNMRGTCDPSITTEKMRAEHPDAYVVFSNLRIGDIDSTYNNAAAQAEDTPKPTEAAKKTSSEAKQAASKSKKPAKKTPAPKKKPAAPKKKAAAAASKPKPKSFGFDAATKKPTASPSKSLR